MEIRGVAFPIRWLTLLMLPLNALAAGGTAWNEEEYEYDFIEAVLLIVLVTVALAFEITWHHMWHEVRHSYHYGMIHDEYFSTEEEPHAPRDRHGNLRHPRLVKELVRRMSGEFMNLGFLALMIFILNQVTFFDWLATLMDSCVDSGGARRLGDSSNCWNVPTTGSDWLHMAEVVHVKLFLTMILYFVLVSRIVWKSNKNIQSWERLRLRRWRELHVSAHKSHLANPDEELKNYKEMREYLIKDVLLWKDSRKNLFRMLLQKLNLRKVPKYNRVQRLREEIDKRLSLSAYLSYNVEQGVVDSIQVHVSTWIGILVMFVIFALFNYFAKVQLAHIIPVFVFVGILFILLMVAVIRAQRREIKRFVAAGTDDELGEDICNALEDELSPTEIETEREMKGICTPATAFTNQTTLQPDRRTWYQRHLKERQMMRVLQASMFMITYALAESLADKHKWSEVPVQTLITSLTYLICLMFLLFVVPSQIVYFLQLTALPPFVDRDNVEVLLQVVVDDHLVKSKHQMVLESIANAEFETAHMAAGKDESGASFSEPISLQQSAWQSDPWHPVMELADVVGRCRDFDELAQVKQQLLLRLQTTFSHTSFAPEKMPAQVQDLQHILQTTPGWTTL